MGREESEVVEKTKNRGQSGHSFIRTHHITSAVCWRSALGGETSVRIVNQRDTSAQIAFHGSEFGYDGDIHGADVHAMTAAIDELTLSGLCRCLFPDGRAGAISLYPCTQTPAVIDSSLSDTAIYIQESMYSPPLLCSAVMQAADARHCGLDRRSMSQERGCRNQRLLGGCSYR